MVDGREPSRDRCLRPSEPSWPSPQEQIIECAPWCARSGVLPQTEGGGEKGTLIASQDDEAGDRLRRRARADPPTPPLNRRLQVVREAAGPALDENGV